MNAKQDENAKKPTAPDELKPNDNLTEKMDELEKELTELKDRNTRLLAEQQNLVNRFNRESETKATYAISKFAKDILDVADILQTGLDSCEDKESEHYQGMDMTLDKLLSLLKQYGITKIDALNTKFNPDLHEALTSQESDQEEGAILQVIQEGYTFKDRVLRPTKVIVAKKVLKEG